MSFRTLRLVEVEEEPEEGGRDVEPVVDEEHEEPVLERELERVARPTSASSCPFLDSLFLSDSS